MTKIRGILVHDPYQKPETNMQPIRILNDLYT
jgi:hypothetical protein